MTDIVSPGKRSRMMSGIKAKNTKPELIIRKELFRRGFRYRLHAGKLPGKPDIVLPKYRAAIFINGCFWHGHGCHLFRWPKSNIEFWREKITGNIQRDTIKSQSLLDEGWRIMTVWECALRGKEKENLQKVLDNLVDWLLSNNRNGEIQ